MIEQILKLREEGIGYKTIAKQLNISARTVSDILFENGITDHMILPRQEIIDRIIELYNSQYGIKKIAHELNISVITVRNMIKLKGLEVPESRYHSGYKTKIDHGYFNVIDTERKAYWFGFLLADGYNDPAKCCIEITLKGEDKPHLEKLRQDIKCNSAVKDRLSHCQTGVFPSARILLSSKKISNRLSDMGCIKKKSLVVAFPNEDIVPINLIRHFIRGYYDGNGSMHMNRGSAYLSIDSTKMFCESLRNIIIANVNVTSLGKYYYRSQNGAIRFTGRINCLKILAWLYEDASIFLERKYQKFLEIINTPFHDRNISGEKPCELLESLKRKYCTS